MGETASTWKTPLHSSDSEHVEQTRRNHKGRGRNLPATDDGHFHGRLSELQGPGANASSVVTNPFHGRNRG